MKSSAAHLTLIISLVSIVNSVHVDFSRSAKAKRKNWCFSGGEDCTQDSPDSRWNSGECKNGIRQSPINIETEFLVKSHNDKKALKDGNIILSEKMSKNYDIIEFNLSIANKTIQIDKMVTATGQGAYFNWEGSKYKLVSAQFTWGSNNDQGSEHQIDGHMFAGELQLIHYKIGTSNGDDEADKGTNGYQGLREAFLSGKPDALAVISFLIEAYQGGKEKKSRRRRFVAGLNKVLGVKPKKGGDGNQHDTHYASLEPVVNGLEKIKNGSGNGNDRVRVLRTFKFTDFFKGQNSTLTYMGSLTTPGCQEIVAWLVCEKPVSVKVAHLQALREGGKDDDGKKLTANFRKIQSISALDGSRRPVKRVSILLEE